jgi:hypothetical protein
MTIQKPQRKSKHRGVSLFGVHVPGLIAGPDSPAAHTTNDLVRTVRDAPAGVAALGRALYADATYQDALAYARAVEKAKREGRKPPPKRSAWDLMAPRTRALGQALGGQLWEDVRHPTRHPGNLLLAAASVATGGALAGARAGEALGAARAASRVSPAARVATRAARPGKLLKAAEPKSPLRAGAGAYLRRPTRGERIAGAGIVGERSAQRERARRRRDAALGLRSH